MIYGERIRLRHVEKEDLSHFVEWLNDPEVRHGLAMYLPLSHEEEQRWFEETLSRPVEERPLAIEIVEEDTWNLVGDCGFFNIDWRNRSAELGIFIGEKSNWNQGYGSETMGLLLQFGFTTLNLHRIFLRVFEDNQRAIKAYKKAGFVEEGRNRQAVFQEGSYFDVLLMSVLRTEWQNKKGSAPPE
jgi:RimJ/RimL family protein N-acetyltransferase